MIINIFTIICLVLGCLFFIGTVVGILRLPDFYTRMHAASKGDTLSSLLLTFGFAVYNLNDFTFINVLVSLKILFIVVFIFIASPTASHALVEAAYSIGAKPWKKGEKPDA